MASYRVLIVEDQREISRLLRSALETLEHDIQVVEAPSGEEAILDASRHRVDLLVSDYRLPGMTGVELMERVNRFNPRTKVILITGQTDPRIRREVAEAGAEAFFIKPVPMADFLDAVERHLGLVGTLLPPEPIQPVDEPEPPPSLPIQLTALRKKLKASAVLLLDDSGRILARAGDLPDTSAEVSLLSSLLSIYSAGQKVSRLLGQKAFSSWNIFAGGTHDLIFVPVGEGHALLTIGQRMAEAGRVMKAMEILDESREGIEAALAARAVPESPPPADLEPRETPAAPQEVGEAELEPLLRTGRKKMKPAEVDDFWNTAVSKQKAPTKPDMLSYDQARQLGLTPEDEG